MGDTEKMKISDEAVEAAAHRFAALAGYDWDKAWDTTADVEADVRADIMRQAREILEAASPHMGAEHKLDAIRHFLRDEGWFGGETPKPFRPILDIINGDT